MVLGAPRLTLALVPLVLMESLLVNGVHLPTPPVRGHNSSAPAAAVPQQRRARGAGVVATMSAISAAISAGSSVVGTTLSNLPDKSASVTVVIQVENWTRYPLLIYTVRLASGVLTTSPTEILPGKREAFATAGEGNHGTYGTVSWEVYHRKRRFVLMWMAPYSSSYTNWMGVGMTREGVTEVPQSNEWYNQMYYYSSDADLKFERQQYFRGLEPVIFRDREFEIVGGMTNTYHSQIKVIFRTSRSNWQNLAPGVREIMKPIVRK